KSGLTEKGRSMIRSMEEKHMIVDLAHASWPTFDDALNIATRPVVVSHTGVKATCNNNRNLSDSQIRRVGANGGLVGVGYWGTAPRQSSARCVTLLISSASSMSLLGRTLMEPSYSPSTPQASSP